MTDTVDPDFTQISQIPHLVPPPASSHLSLAARSRAAFQSVGTFRGIAQATLIFNALLYGGLDFYSVVLGLIQSMMNMSPFLFLLMVVDVSVFMAHIKNKKWSPSTNHSPPWIALFISLFAINVIFFLIAAWELSQSAGGVAGILILPAGLVLVIIDVILMLSYVYVHLPNGRAKIIFYMPWLL